MQQKIAYPTTRTVDQVDDYHGTLVADPYRWMEDYTSAEVRAWLDEQNAVTDAFLSRVTVSERLRERLTAIWNYAKYFPIPIRKGSRYFYGQNDGLQNQPVLYVRDSLHGEPRAVLDPNMFSSDGTVALTNLAISDDGRYVAYGTSSGGSDWQEIRVRDVDSGQDYPEVIRWCRFAAIAWKHDGSGFFYNRSPEPREGGSIEESYRNNILCWHRLGTAQAEDVVIYRRPDAPELNFPPTISDDGQYIVLEVWHGAGSENRVYYRAVDSEDDFVRLIDTPDAHYHFTGSRGTTFYFRTDLGAPRWRLIAIDIANPAREHWRELIPQGKDVLDSVRMYSGGFVVTYLEDAHHRLFLYGLDGERLREIDLPGIGAVDSFAGLSASSSYPDIFISFASFLFPATVFHYDTGQNQVAPYLEPKIDIQADQFETNQVFYTSRDGTRVPMFVTHRKGMPLNGDNPTLLYAYGGFNYSLTPWFSAAAFVWVENGGVFAVANLRGGGEYGEAWHQAGMLGNKQNVFDDFIGAGEWLIENRYTSSQKLAIMGGSNGGLLVAACMLQRPELFGAIICSVPVVDMLRYHRFTAGRFWTPEYGNAEENPEHFRFLYAYSPVHNVQPGTTYPPTLILTADGDDRVVPMHAFKLAAALQAADSGQNPIFLHFDTRAGHGFGKPVSKLIDEQVVIYGFLAEIFGMSIH